MRRQRKTMEFLNVGTSGFSSPTHDTAGKCPCVTKRLSEAMPHGRLCFHDAQEATLKGIVPNLSFPLRSRLFQLQV